MWTVVNSVGRLIEARLTTTDSAAIFACLSAIAHAVANSPCPVVGILDLSQVRVFGPEDAEHMVTVMRGHNPRVERTAILVNGDALFGMQMERLVRAAAARNRQVFRFGSQAVAWLSEVLSPEELARARSFIAEPATRNFAQ
jgi:hypothetical protein